MSEAGEVVSSGGEEEDLARSPRESRKSTSPCSDGGKKRGVEKKLRERIAKLEAEHKKSMVLWETILKKKGEQLVFVMNRESAVVNKLRQKLLESESEVACLTAELERIIGHVEEKNKPQAAIGKKRLSDLSHGRVLEVQARQDRLAKLLMKLHTLKSSDGRKSTATVADMAAATAMPSMSKWGNIKETLFGVDTDEEAEAGDEEFILKEIVSLTRTAISFGREVCEFSREQVTSLQGYLDDEIERILSGLESSNYVTQPTPRGIPAMREPISVPKMQVVLDDPAPRQSLPRVSSQYLPQDAHRKSSMAAKRRTEEMLSVHAKTMTPYGHTPKASLVVKRNSSLPRIAAPRHHQQPSEEVSSWTESEGNVPRSVPVPVTVAVEEANDITSWRGGDMSLHEPESQSGDDSDGETEDESSDDAVVVVSPKKRLRKIVNPVSPRGSSSPRRRRKKRKPSSRKKPYSPPRPTPPIDSRKKLNFPGDYVAMLHGVMEGIKRALCNPSDAFEDEVGGENLKQLSDRLVWFCKAIKATVPYKYPKQHHVGTWTGYAHDQLLLAAAERKADNNNPHRGQNGTGTYLGPSLFEFEGPPKQLDYGQLVELLSRQLPQGVMPARKEYFLVREDRGGGSPPERIRAALSSVFGKQSKQSAGGSKCHNKIGTSPPPAPPNEVTKILRSVAGSQSFTQSRPRPRPRPAKRGTTVTKRSAFLPNLTSPAARCQSGKKGLLPQPPRV